MPESRKKRQMELRHTTLIEVGFTLFAFGISCCIGQDVRNFVPVLEVPGNPLVIVILDLHKTLLENGTCTSMNPRAVERALSIKWLNSVLQTDGAKIGFTIYDTCGSKQRAMEIVSSHVNPKACLNASGMAGIISHTKPDIRDAISDVTRHLGILHINLDDTGYIARGINSTFTVPTYSIWKLEAVIQIMKNLDWNHVTAYADGTENTMQQLDLFLKMANKHSVCVADVGHELKNVSLSNPKTNGTVIFISDFRDVEDFLGNLDHTTRKYIIVSNTEIGKTPLFVSGTVLYMAENFNSRPALLSYIAAELLQSDNQLTKNYLSDLDFCENNVTLNLTLCGNELNSYLEYRTKRTDILAVLTAYFNAYRITNRAETHNCTGYFYSSCPSAYSFVTIKQAINEFPFNLQESPDKLYMDEPSRVDVSVIGIPTAQVGLIYQTTFTPTNLSVWKKVKTEMGVSKCDAMCSKCGSCHHTSMNHKYNSMNKDGDLVISGDFPIRGISQAGQTCGAIDTEGIQLAEALFYAVDTIKSRYRGQNILPGVDIGAIVQDSCQFEQTTCAPDVENDLDNFISFRQADQSASAKNAKTKFLLSSHGVSINEISYFRYIRAVSDMLNYLNWTYIHLVYSKDMRERPDVLEGQKYLQEKICIASKTTLDYNKTLSELSIKMLLNMTRKTGAIVLLTTPEDTKFIIDVLNQNNGSYNPINLVVLPWEKQMNFDLLPGSVVLHPKPEIDTNFQTYLSSVMNPNNNLRNLWLQEFFEDYNKCYSELDSDTLYPTSCSDIIPSMTNISTSPTTTSVIQIVDMILLALDKLYKDLCPSQTGICKEFRSYDVSGYIRSRLIENGLSEMSDSGFTMYGEFKMPFEIVNYQLVNSASSPVSVGVYSSMDDLIVDKNAIKTYDDKNNPVVASHKCKDWCPSCYSCETATKRTTGFLYQEGDVVFTGIFPLHKKGTKALACGPLALDKGSELLAEAFVYALETAKTRYNYLLPDVNLGSLILDSCSNVDIATQTILNFESCGLIFDKGDNQMPANHLLVPGYVLPDNQDISFQLDRILQTFEKFSLTFNSADDSNPLSLLFNPNSKASVITIVALLQKMNWTYVDLVFSADNEHSMQKDWFMSISKSYNVCIDVAVSIQAGNSESVSGAISSLSQSTTNVIIMLVSSEAAREFFAAVVNRPLPKLYILGENIKDWRDTTGITLPRGSIVVDRSGKINYDFKNYYDQITQTQESKYGNHWFEDILKARASCTNTADCSPPTNILSDASKIILGVDVMLHALHLKYLSLCPEKQGLCAKFAEMGLSLNGADFQNVSFQYQSQILQFPLTPEKHGSFLIRNLQTSGFVEVGKWQNGILSFEENKLRAYDSNGNQRGSLPTSICYLNCKCSNSEVVPNITTTPLPILNTDLLFYDTSEQFHSQLWAIVLLTIASGGSLVSLMFIVYVIYKVCSGLLHKRYIGLGLMLLVSLIALYLSILPFVFTPSENICSLRFFLPGLTYAFTYAIILSKLMSLRAYKLIGLGGEISNLNQFLTVIFVTGVQIAIGVQWWIVRGSLFVMQTSAETDVTKYACDFVKTDFVIYHVYVMFLIVLSAFYAILVRKETKNMGEAKLILASSWITIAIWIAWIAVLVIQPHDFTDPTICVGVIVSASVIILVVFVPKLHRISRLKYDVKKSGMENGGYKIDPDFMFERPYTLPAMRSSFKYSETKTNPKSISKFDSSLSY